MYNNNSMMKCISDAKYSPDGRYVGVRDFHHVYLYDVRNPLHPLFNYHLHHGYNRSFSSSPSSPSVTSPRSNSAGTAINHQTFFDVDDVTNMSSNEGFSYSSYLSAQTTLIIHQHAINSFLSFQAAYNKLKNHNRFLAIQSFISSKPSSFPLPLLTSAVEFFFFLHKI
jgi:hypothetical protein